MFQEITVFAKKGQRAFLLQIILVVQACQSFTQGWMRTMRAWCSFRFSGWPGHRAVLMRCVKTANLKFTQRCPKQAHNDYMPVGDTSRALGPHCGLWQMYIQYVHTPIDTHTLCTLHTYSHTLTISVCLTEKDVEALPVKQDKHLKNVWHK